MTWPKNWTLSMNIEHVLCSHFQFRRGNTSSNFLKSISAIVNTAELHFDLLFPGISMVSANGQVAKYPVQCCTQKIDQCHALSISTNKFSGVEESETFLCSTKVTELY